MHPKVLQIRELRRHTEKRLAETPTEVGLRGVVNRAATIASETSELREFAKTIANLMYDYEATKRELEMFNVEGAPERLSTERRNKKTALIQILVEMEQTILPATSISLSNRVFIVHGHDNEMKQSVARTLTALKLKPLILHELPNAGRAIIEQITEYSDVAYAVVLLSPDDFGYAKNDPKKKRPRARQNVILEMGYFIGKLGRNRVFTLYREEPNFELPSDIAGVLYTPYDERDAWKLKLVLELRACGFKVSADDLLA